MKNVNIFVDVDLTLVDQNMRLLEGAKENLELLIERGCHIFLWSTCGTEYCRKIAELHKLTHLIEGYSAKPDIIIDDMPGTVLNPFHFDVQRDGGWPEMTKTILKKHVD
ncbi:MAG TPA: hypothetical protein VF773_00550 [Verrucomicrobiae bacterium]